MRYLQDIYFSNLTAVYHTGGFFSIPPGADWSLAPNSADFSKFYYIKEGGCVIRIDGKDYCAEPGSWFLIPKNTKHSYYNLKNRPFQKYWIHFELYAGEELFSLLRLPYCISVEKTEKIDALFAGIIARSGSRQLADQLTVKAQILSLMAEYLQIAQPEGVFVQSEGDARLDALLAYINKHLDKPLSNRTLAEKMYMHPNHFIRFFKDKTGQTPAHYIRLKRLETARLLLEDTELSLSEIMRRIGVSDPGHFSKIFKEYYNMPPGNYRRFIVQGHVQKQKDARRSPDEAAHLQNEIVSPPPQEQEKGR